jgi:hypothetical protein
MRDRRGGGVPVLHDVVVDAVIRQAEGLLHGLRDPQVGLVRDEQIHVGETCRTCRAAVTTASGILRTATLNTSRPFIFGK